MQAVALEPALDAAERRQDPIEPEPERGAGVLRIVVVEGRGAGHFEIETALVSWIVGAVAGPAILRVVGRRARADEREAVGVVVRVEEVRELVGRLGDAQ